MSALNRVKQAALALGLFFTLVGTPVFAGSLPAPEGEPILIVSGLVPNTNQDGKAVFDRAMLEAMPAVTFSTTTIWTEGEVEFIGVSLAELLRLLGIESGTLKATAVNDYAVDIPVADALVDPAILAYKMNGETMSLRDKGPLWIVFPFDSDKKYQSEIYYSRSVWQLDRITVQQ